MVGGRVAEKGKEERGKRGWGEGDSKGRGVRTREKLGRHTPRSLSLLSYCPLSHTHKHTHTRSAPNPVLFPHLLRASCCGHPPPAMYGNDRLDVPLRLMK